MGYAFILSVILGGIDLIRIAKWLQFRFSGKRTCRKNQYPALLAVSLAVVLTIYGAYEAQDIRTEYLKITNPKIKGPSTGVRIVLLSDVHLGVMIGKWRLQRMLAAVQAARPDLIVVTGDVVDGQIHRMNGFAEMFLKVSPRYGMYAVLGNHEYYAGVENSINFLQRAGFKVLRKETATPVPFLTIAGVDDPVGARWGDTSGSNEQGFLPDGERKSFTVLLKHRPVIHPGSRGRFDLQLSGHVHKGQIFPFNFLTYLSFPVKAGANRFADGSMLYVSRGTGTWGPPIRFLAPPEVTVIDLIPR
jgi:predicted MPP superfamily phosphohydrolase